MKADRIINKNAGEILWDELRAEEDLKHPTPKPDKWHWRGLDTSSACKAWSVKVRTI